MAQIERTDLEIKIFATSVYFQELLDLTPGETPFKNKARFHINGLQDCLNKLGSVKLPNEETEQLILKAVASLEKAFDIEEIK